MRAVISLENDPALTSDFESTLKYFREQGDIKGLNAYLNRKINLIYKNIIIDIVIYMKILRKEIFCMKRYSIFYENIGGSEHYLDKIMELLDGQQSILFHIDGYIVDLDPGMTKDEVINRINVTKDKFKKEEMKIVERQEDESLIAFAKRIVQMSKTNNSYYRVIYKSQQIIAAPGCDDFGILYQIMQINAKILAEDENTEKMQANPGEEYMHFGERIFKELQKGKNIKGYFNSVIMPFTSDLDNLSEFIGRTRSGGMKPSDAFTFASMINHLQYVMYEQAEAFENARKNKQTNHEQQQISPTDALKNALSSGTTNNQINEVNTKQPLEGEQAQDKQ